MSEIFPESELIERLALEDLHRAATPEIIHALRLKLIRRGSQLISVAAELPPSAVVVNRTLGLGIGAKATENDLSTLLAEYRDVGVERFFVHRHPTARPAGLTEMLHRAGLQKARGWQKFSRGPENLPLWKDMMDVREIGSDYAAEFAHIACQAFDLGEKAMPWLARLPGREGWHVFMSFLDGQPAGVGSVYISNGLAWTDFGATAPDFRRRGCQSILLARRIQFAFEEGCRRVYTCTGEEVPGDPQHSFHNIVRMGFTKDYVRDNYALPPD